MKKENERSSIEKENNPSARSDERTIRHETIPGKGSSDVDRNKTRNPDGKSRLSTTDEDLN